MADYRWSVVGRHTKPRRVHGQPLRADRRQPYGAETGWWAGGLNVVVVSYGATYAATHRLLRPVAEVRRLFRLRAQIEVCQTPAVTMPWCPLRRAPWTRSDPRGLLTRGPGGDLDWLARHHPWAEQAVRHRLALFT